MMTNIELMQECARLDQVVARLTRERDALRAALKECHPFVFDEADSLGDPYVAEFRSRFVALLGGSH